MPKGKTNSDVKRRRKDGTESSFRSAGELSNEEIIERREAALKRMLSTPRTPHKSAATSR